MKIIKKQTTFKEELDRNITELGADAKNTEYIAIDYDEAISLAKAFNAEKPKGSLFKKTAVTNMTWNIGAIHGCVYRGITLKVEGLE